MSLPRARSWPLLDAATVAGDSSEESKRKTRRPEVATDDDAKCEEGASRPDGSPQLQARRLLCRHYYPEGGWGWVVAVVGTLVHLLGSGLQLSVPATVASPAKVKFYHHPLDTAGESRLSRSATAKCERGSLLPISLCREGRDVIRESYLF